MRVPVALTIAGSDSGGGAGIQADLKAFAALGVHGAVAVTAITAQNTYEVRAVRKIEPELVRAQIRAVVEDMGVDSAKTGMLYDQDIIRVVAEEWRSIAKPLVVDPVMVAKSGARLLKEEAIRALKEELLPLATVATPNVPEAEVLADLKIKDVEDMKEAARRLASLGAKAVVVKGGHLPLASGRLMNVLYLDGETHEHELPYYPVGTTHGSGCAFSAAIAAELAKGRDIEEAVELAGRLTSEAIKRGLSLGKGHGPVNPMAELYAKADELTALEDVKRAVRMLEQLGSGDVLSPESQINVAVALRHAEGPHDIIAIPGRIVNVMGRLRASAWPERGASKHLANYLLVLQRLKPEVRAAVNIKFSKKFVERALALGLQVSSYDRRQEPPSVKAVEGGTTRWGAEQAVASLGAVPDVIYHEGDVGKEPMIVVLGRTAEEAVRRALLIAGLVDAFKA